MAEYTIGQEIRVPFYTGSPGEGFTSAAVDRAVYDDDTDFTGLIAFEDAGSGDYELVFTPVVVGTYRARWTSPVTQTPFVDAWTVTDPASDAQTVASAVLAASVTGGAANTVAGQLEALNDLVTSNVTVVSALSTSQDLTVSPGVTYSGVTALSWSADWPVSLVGATVTFTAYANDQPQLSVVGSVAGDVISVALTSTQTAGLALSTPFYEWRYEVNAALSGGSSAQLVAGEMTVST